MRQLWIIACLLAATLGIAPAQAQTGHYEQGEAPPKVPLWGTEENGDAVQRDLGFVFPAEWKTFKRTRFSSTRADGASVKVWYQTPDNKMHIGILVQLRIDIRGIEVSPDLTWDMMSMAADIEQSGDARAKPTILSTAPFSLGGRDPAGRMRWSRYDLPDGARLHGMWLQNIGMWSVAITVSGPDQRKAEVEEAAATLLKDMAFPRAPIAAELMASGKKLLDAMPACDKSVTAGRESGRPMKPTVEDATLFGILLPGFFLAETRPPSPASTPQDYCLIERFQIDKLPVAAILHKPQPGKYWESRFGFILDNGRAGYFQFDRSKAGLEAKMPPVALTFTNAKSAVLTALLTDWPSYAEAKKLIAGMGKDAQRMATARSPAKEMRVEINSALPKADKEGATPTAAQPPSKASRRR